MSQSIQSGKTTVTGSVTTSTTITSTTPLTVIKSLNQSSGTVTLGTVGAGKEWRIVAFSIGAVTNTNSYYNGSMTLNANGSSILTLRTGSTTTNETTAWNKDISLPFGCYIAVSAGNTVQAVFAGNGGTYDVYVYYTEVSV